MKVVKPGPLPQPLEHECRSTQFPARPQSEANNTVVGQKPQRLRSRSTRHSKPPLAVRSLVGSPDEKTVANLVIRGSRFWTWAGTVPDDGVGATTADSTQPARRRGRKRRGNIPCLDYLEQVELILDEGNQTRKRRRRSRQDPERRTSPDCTARPADRQTPSYMMAWLDAAAAGLHLVACPRCTRRDRLWGRWPPREPWRHQRLEKIG